MIKTIFILTEKETRNLLMKDFVYDTDGKLSFYSLVRKYDKNIEKHLMKYDSVGNLVNDFYNTYKYDGEGNWIERIYTNPFRDDSTTGEIVDYKVKRVINYYK